MNSNLERFIADAKRIATANGVLWSIPLDGAGVAGRRAGWNLTLIAKASFLSSIIRKLRFQMIDDNFK